MITPEILEAMLKAEVLSSETAATLRATCRALKEALTGHMPDASYTLRFQKGPKVIVVAVLGVALSPSLPSSFAMQAQQVRRFRALIGANLACLTAPADAISMLPILSSLVEVTLTLRKSTQSLSLLSLEQLPNLRRLVLYASRIGVSVPVTGLEELTQLDTLTLDGVGSSPGLPPGLTSLTLGDDDFVSAGPLRATTGSLLSLDLSIHICDWQYNPSMLAGQWSQNLTYLAISASDDDIEWPQCSFQFPRLQHLKVQLEAVVAPANVWDLAALRLQCLTLEAHFNDELAGTFPLNQIINVSTELVQFALDLGNKGKRLAVDFSTWQLQRVELRCGYTSGSVVSMAARDVIAALVRRVPLHAVTLNAEALT